jgi:hypothetical protein
MADRPPTRLGRPTGDLATADANRLRSAADRIAQARRDVEAARANLASAVRQASDAGASVRSIAKALGVSHQRAHQLLAQTARSAE